MPTHKIYNQLYFRLLFLSVHKLSQCIGTVG